MSLLDTDLLRDRLSEAFNLMNIGTTPTLGLTTPPTKALNLGKRGINLNIGETDDSYKIVAEMPGIPKQNINISLEEGILTIRGEKQRPEDFPEKDADILLEESTYGKLSRTIRLPNDIDPENCIAKFENGLLCLNIAKSSGTRARTIEIGEGSFGTAQLGETQSHEQLEKGDKLTGLQGTEKSTESKGAEQPSMGASADQTSGLIGQEQSTGFGESEQSSAGYTGVEQPSGLTDSDKSTGLQGSEQSSGWTGTQQPSGLAGSEQSTEFKKPEQSSGWTGTDQSTGLAGSEQSTGWGSGGQLTDSTGTEQLSDIKRPEQPTSWGSAEQSSGLTGLGMGRGSEGETLGGKETPSGENVQLGGQYGQGTTQGTAGQLGQNTGAGFGDNKERRTFF